MMLLFSGVPNLYGQELNPFDTIRFVDINYDYGGYTGNMFSAGNKNNASYLSIIDSRGYPIYMKKVPSGTSHLQPHSDGRLSFHNRLEEGYILMNNRFEPIDTIRMHNGYIPDLHEFHIDFEGNYWMLAYPNSLLDMSGIVEGGSPNTTVTGLIVQQIDPQGRLLFEWDGSNYFEITDTYQDLMANSIDYIHGNSLQRDTDTTFILSSRNVSEVSRIDMVNKSFIWRLGGEKNQFSFTNDTRKIDGQHTAFYTPQGYLYLYDNGVFTSQEYSRGLIYQLNESTLEATLVDEFIHDSLFKARFMGNIQPLPNGNSFINWGVIRDKRYGAVTEYGPTGEPILDAYFNDIYGYRIYKANWKPAILKLERDSLFFEKPSSDFEATQTLRLTNQLNNTFVLNAAHSLNDRFRLKEELPMEIAPGESIDLTIEFIPDRVGLNAEHFYLGYISDTLMHAVSVFMEGESGVSGNPKLDRVSLKVFPNPFRDYLQVDLQGPRSSYALYDLSGLLVLKGQLRGNRIETGSLPRGVYLLKIETPSQTFIHKVTKIMK